MGILILTFSPRNLLFRCLNWVGGYGTLGKKPASHLLTMPHKKGVWLHQSIGVFLALVVSISVAWPLPQTQDLKGVVVSAKGSPIADALCTLTGVGLPMEGIS